MAVAMTLVPINSTLNRVMIKELALSATLVAILALLPYLLSPIQVAIGSFSDRHPLFGFRRTPYIVAGLLLCVLGVVVSPQVAFLMATNFWAGVGLGLLAFGAWGMGFNLATVSYFSLASEVSGESGRGRTIAVMFFMMIASIIATAIVLSRLVEPYSPQALVSAFQAVGLLALGLGLIGVLRVETRHAPAGAEKPAEAYTWKILFQAIWENRQARLFFWYLLILLAALLGQDVLLEPFAAEAFQMTVQQTTRITAIWGVCVLAALLLAGFLESRASKKIVALWGGWIAALGFGLIVAAGVLLNSAVFYGGVVLLGTGTGLSTVSNLSLMLDMTAPGKVGLFIGAWGMANAFSRLTGSLLSAVVRDLVVQVAGDPLLGYLTVFSMLGAFMLISLTMLQRIDVANFRRQAGAPGLVERAALASES
jgi:BCD family chlorophyll transporter-like MFS transporter